MLINVITTFDTGKNMLVESKEYQKDDFIGLEILVEKQKGWKNNIVD